MEILIIILVNIIDRLSKLWAVKQLKSGSDIVIIKNIFSFSYLENQGAAWGIFQGKIIFLLIVTITIFAGIVYFFVKYKPKNKVLRLSLSLIIGGAAGNMFDRAVYKHVVDFIFFHYKDVYSFPTFNVADISVVIGTFLLAICLLRNEN